jgi:hypothetical protein
MTEHTPTPVLGATGRIHAEMGKGHAVRLIEILSRALVEERDMVLLEFDLLTSGSASIISINRLWSGGMSAIATVTDNNVGVKP